MDFTLSPKAEDLRRRVIAFMDQYVYPAEKIHREQVAAPNDPHRDPPITLELRKKAKAEGLWNLFLPDKRYGKGLKNEEYAPLAKLMGRSPIGAARLQLYGAGHGQHGDPCRVRHRGAKAALAACLPWRAKSGPASP